MSNPYRTLMLRGRLGVALACLAVAGATTQALGFDGELRFEHGHLVLVPRSATPEALLCARSSDGTQSLLANRRVERG